MTRTARRALWLSIFAVAMGILEAVVVVYLRELYYPGGFRFPIAPMPARMAVAELVRETATIVMLLSAAALARRRGADGFFVFGYLFGVWDLTYYAGLYGFLGWPESFSTWDILFLIPVPWLSPVLYPAVVSVFLIAGFAAHELARSRNRSITPSRRGWAVACAGALGIVVAFCWRFRDVLEGRLPERFPRTLFWLSLVVAAAPFALRALAASRDRGTAESGAPL